jgi:hypothetical protein
VVCCGSFGKEIIAQFFETLADVKPQLVSRDSSSVLEYRAMRHKLPMPHFCRRYTTISVPLTKSLCATFSRLCGKKSVARILCGVERAL